MRGVRDLWHSLNHLAPATHWPGNATRREKTHQNNRGTLSGDERASMPPEPQVLLVCHRVLAFAASDLRCRSNAS